MTIDAHQHFWKFDPQKHSWINDEMAVIRKDFFPTDLQEVYAANNIDACVAVQADETEAETDFLIGLAEEFDFIKAVVGWVDLKSDDIRERLSHYQSFPVLKGFRHILQAQDPSFMLQPGFLNGISQLDAFGYTYDILVFPQHLPSVIEMVSKFPNQKFVIDHIAKPFIKDKLPGDWKVNMEKLSSFQNVFCKLSGMVTEADYHHWKETDFVPYIDTVVHAFGTKRIMFGSDWPVCLVAASYERMMSILKNYFADYSSAEKEDIFGMNAARFYNIETFTS